MILVWKTWKNKIRRYSKKYKYSPSYQFQNLKKKSLLKNPKRKCVYRITKDPYRCKLIYEGNNEAKKPLKGKQGESEDYPLTRLNISCL